MDRNGDFPASFARGYLQNEANFRKSGDPKMNEGRDRNEEEDNGESPFCCDPEVVLAVIVRHEKQLKFASTKLKRDPATRAQPVLGSTKQWGALVDQLGRSQLAGMARLDN